MATHPPKGTRITRIKEFFNQHMAATALAEEGLSQGAMELIDAKPIVLLVVEGEWIGARTLKYAVDLCHRTSSILDILHIQHKKAQNSHRLNPNPQTITDQPLLTTQEAREKGLLDIPFREHIANGSFLDTITLFIRTRKQIISVILEKLTYSRSTSLKKLPLYLPCPLITI